MSNGVAHGDLTLFDCPRVRRSEYWQFIKLVAPTHAGALPAGQTHWLSQDASDAFCLKCEKMFRFLKGSSNSVRRHMERFHKSELRRHQARADELAKESGLSGGSGASSKAPNTSRSTGKRSLPDALDIPLSSPTSDSTSAAETPTDALAHVASSSAKKARESGFGALEQRHASDLLVKWLSRSLRGLSVVEDAGFADFVAYVSGAQGFVVPDRAALRHRQELLVESARFELRQRVKRELGPCALSLEQWRVASSDEAFVALACHALTEDFAPLSWTLDVLPLRPDDDTATLTAHIGAALRDWGVRKQAVALLVSGDDARLMSTGRALELPCILDALNAASSILSTSFAELLGFAQALRASAAASSSVFELCSAVVDPERLTLVDPQSWMSVFALLTHMTRVMGSLDRLFAFVTSPGGRAALADVAPPLTTPPPPRTWFVAEALALVLQPFDELARVVARERVCSLPLVLPCLAVVKQQLARDDLFRDLVLQYRTAARGKDSALVDALAQLETFRLHVLRAFADEYDALCDALSWCAALEPRYGRLRHAADDAARDECKRTLAERAMALVEQQQLASVVSTSESLSALPSAFESDLLDSSGAGARAAAVSATHGLMHRLLYDDDEDVATPEPLSRDAELAQTKLYVANEVQLYVSAHQARKTRVTDPLEWWRLNHERYPYLAPLARTWLGVVASSGPAQERREVPLDLWHDAVQHSSDSRARARKTTADALFLHANLRAQSDASISL